MLTRSRSRMVINESGVGLTNVVPLKRMKATFFPVIQRERINPITAAEACQPKALKVSELVAKLSEMPQDAFVGMLDSEGSFHPIHEQLECTQKPPRMWRFGTLNFEAVLFSLDESAAP